ncbi:SAV_6107 family HEPN domain-containing protein [Nocardiopsis ansamitocini]|uniref:SAV-6107-like HEPN domain-containing protein n=1 Tax=Nocardiopsis ansamitocini TaxID=1670832 RepID=A0A9W6P2Q8_9ACTN|nr:SAV_6107 family HEPN domain-containing protein [Nocardiopsis ansamitocini]GLU46044.1 hypothetical protein Nans01_03950 [Nocardiopsis ansamitocini]
MSQPAIFSVSDVARRPRRTLVPGVGTALDSARGYLTESADAPTPALRYVNAHLAALRTAAAVLAQRADPGAKQGRARGPRSAWELLPAAAPELHEWALYFAAGAAKRAAAEAGLGPAVTAEQADVLLNDARAFLAVVESLLGCGPLRRTG